jgi:hypothetical protein
MSQSYENFDHCLLVLRRSRTVPYNSQYRVSLLVLYNFLQVIASFSRSNVCVSSGNLDVCIKYACQDTAIDDAFFLTCHTSHHTSLSSHLACE